MIIENKRNHSYVEPCELPSAGKGMERYKTREADTTTQIEKQKKKIVFAFKEER